MKIERFEQLIAWQKSHELVLEVYRISKQFPSDERFGLTSQLRRAAVSIPANIAEGFKRRSQPEKCRFYNIAEAPLEEARYYFILAKELGYISDNTVLLTQADEAARLTKGLIQSVEASRR
jgi:four helix bundle protein